MTDFRQSQRPFNLFTLFILALPFGDDSTIVNRQQLALALSQVDIAFNGSDRSDGRAECAGGDGQAWELLLELE